MASFCAAMCQYEEKRSTRTMGSGSYIRWCLVFVVIRASASLGTAAAVIVPVINLGSSTGRALEASD